MEQSRAETPAGPAAVPSAAGPPSGVPRPLAPAVPGPARRATEPSTARARRTDGSARGEHTHCEPAAPKVVPQRHSVRDQILEALRGALLSGELAPGEVYSAPALGERFGVSPTPVREAMQLLASEGAVETVPNRGFRVAAHSPRDLAELTEVQALLEVPAVLGLARALPPGYWAELRPLADDTLQAAACGDRTAYAETDLAFHRALLEATGNRQLVAVAEDVRRRARLSALRATPAPRTTDLLAEAADHLALLDALADQDYPAVERLVRGHF
ncbi:GntR family transcriptional regulator [Streptomyces qinglanensis]|uniref:GntR family transcriptional regulator n=1 Tax=Streptomyces qinglanensis TaxID=943816 RepID=A0A1E7K759_9ACTN|nr:GntR family transcriptional regulator [Streptomyces qinglanensis]OEU99772.1 GntR family transcriptional regulator [Streptomyces qinglanensis]OEV27177.1 GntR family transcriptional regulator [Streptomyces nanshensis]